MHTLRGFGRRAAASLLAATMTFSTVPPVAARETILGTITVTGPAFAATPTTDWVKITAPRPLVSGDRLRTGSGGNLVADLGQLGIIGLYGDSELSVTERGNDVTVDARRGKVAFHMTPGSPVKLVAGGAVIASGTGMADGYVEFDAGGVPAVVAESDSLGVMLSSGTVKTLARGDRLVLTGEAGPAPSAMAAEDERKAGAVPTAPQASHKKAGISPLGWTAIAALVVAVGAGVGIGVGGGGGGGGGDTNGSGG
jgi:hypothetical protein